MCVLSFFLSNTIQGKDKAPHLCSPLLLSHWSDSVTSLQSGPTAAPPPASCASSSCHALSPDVSSLHCISDFPWLQLQDKKQKEGKDESSQLICCRFSKYLLLFANNSRHFEEKLPTRSHKDSNWRKLIKALTFAKVNNHCICVYMVYSSIVSSFLRKIET